nr:hypothetical protein [Tanacetum cinerariifolium]
SSDSIIPWSPDHPLTHVSPTPTPTRASSYRRTTRMTVRAQPTKSPGLSASMTESMILSDLAFRKRYRSSYETPSPSLTLLVRKRIRSTSELILDTKSKGNKLREKDTYEDESLDVDDKRERERGSEEAAIPEGQQRAALVTNTIVGEPLGLGYGALRRRELEVEEDQIVAVEVATSEAIGDEANRDDGEIDLTDEPLLTVLASPNVPTPAIPVPAPAPVISRESKRIKQINFKKPLSPSQGLTKEDTMLVEYLESLDRVKNTSFDLVKCYLCISFSEGNTAKGIGLCVTDSHTNNHREDDFTRLETIQRFLGVIGSRSFSSSEGRPSSQIRGHVLALEAWAGHAAMQRELQEVVLHNVMNRRTRELMSTLLKARATCDAIWEKEKDKDKAYAELQAKWAGGESTWVTVMAKVVSHVGMELVHSDEMGLLVAQFIKMGIIHVRLPSLDDFSYTSLHALNDVPVCDLHLSIRLRMVNEGGGLSMATTRNLAPPGAIGKGFTMPCTSVFLHLHQRASSASSTLVS